MDSFWAGFAKAADGALTGGAGFSGIGKGNVGSAEERDSRQGPERALGPAAEADLVDKTLIDRDRNPRSFDITDPGQEALRGNNPFLID